MAVQTVRVSSDEVEGALVTYSFQGTFSTASVKCSGLSPVFTSAWSSLFTQRWSEDQLMRDGYRDMGPTNLGLAKAFSGKVRKSWPEW